MASEDILVNLEKEYKLIVEVILQNENESGICEISQYKIAEKTHLQQGRVAKVFKGLYNDNCLNKINNGKYQIIRKDLEKFGPLTKLLKLLSVLKEYPEMNNLSRKEQAKLIDITVPSLASTYGLLYSTYGSPNSEDK